LGKAGGKKFVVVQSVQKEEMNFVGTVEKYFLRQKNIAKRAWIGYIIAGEVRNLSFLSPEKEKLGGKQNEETFSTVAGCSGSSRSVRRLLR
jgi:hypothetical protein